jgi:hypothetical protein
VEGDFPSLHHRKGGRATKEKREASFESEAGVVFRWRGWKTTPSASALVASRYLLRTQPPLLAAMQGGVIALMLTLDPFRRELKPMPMLM